jgi:hypothetical protein
MCATSGQGNDVVHSQVSAGVARYSPPWAVITVTESVLSQYCLSYCSVPTGVAPGMCTATLPITLG